MSGSYQEGECFVDTLYTNDARSRNHTFKMPVFTRGSLTQTSASKCASARRTLMPCTLKSSDLSHYFQLTNSLFILWARGGRKKSIIHSFHPPPRISSQNTRNVLVHLSLHCVYGSWGFPYPYDAIVLFSWISSKMVECTCVFSPCSIGWPRCVVRVTRILQVSEIRSTKIEREPTLR
jgi:hypothetical protein